METSPQIDADERSSTPLSESTETDLPYGAISDIRQIFDDTATDGYGGESMQIIAKYLRVRQRIVSEIESAKEWFELFKSRQQSRLRALDYVCGEQVQRDTIAALQGVKTKSLSTPWGVVGFRKSPAKIVVLDEQAVMANDKFVRVKQELNKAALNEYFKITGDVPDGCDVEPEHEQFYVR